jgi:hypothetical protein
VIEASAPLIASTAFSKPPHLMRRRAATCKRNNPAAPAGIDIPRKTRTISSKSKQYSQDICHGQGKTVAFLKTNAAVSNDVC